MSTEPATPLRVSRLQIKDFGCVEELDIQPKQAAIVILKGTNAQGKTCALNAMVAVLMGKRGDPAMPIREGCDKATAIITLADGLADRYSASVTWTEKRRYLTVKEIIPGTGGQTRRLTGGQKDQSFLTQLATSLSYRALAFMQAKEADRLPMLLAAAGKQAEYDALMTTRCEHFANRTDVNRLAGAAKTELLSHPDPSPTEQLAPIDTEALNAQLQRALQHDKTIDANAARIDAYRQDILKSATALEDQKKRLATLTEEIAKHEQDITARHTKLASAERTHADAETTRIGSEGTGQQLKNAAQHNATCEQQRRSRELAADAAKHNQNASALTARLADIDGQIRGLLVDTPLANRLPSLIVDDNGNVLYDGRPLGSASGMQQLEMSCLIGMAMNPQLHVMRIDEGDMLDEAAMHRLHAIATEHDHQIWMSAIYAGLDSDKALTIRMEAGRSPDSTPPAAAAVAAGEAGAQEDFAAMYAKPDATSEDHAEATATALGILPLPQQTSPVDPAAPQAKPPARTQATSPAAAPTSPRALPDLTDL